MQNGAYSSLCDIRSYFLNILSISLFVTRRAVFLFDYQIIPIRFPLQKSIEFPILRSSLLHVITDEIDDLVGSLDAEFPTDRGPYGRFERTLNC